MKTRSSVLLILGIAILMMTLMGASACRKTTTPPAVTTSTSASSPALTTSSTTTTTSPTTTSTISTTTTTTSPTTTTTAPSSTPPSTTPGGTSPTGGLPSLTVNTSTSPTLGNYLVDGRGMTLYFTTRDTVGKSNITGATLANWPVFYSPRITVPDPLKASDFGTITRDDGAQQSTYKGWPLYYYINDKDPGDTKGHGIGGVWFVINPANFPATPTATVTGTSSPTGTPSSTTTSSPTTTTLTPPATSPTSSASPVTLSVTAQNFAFSPNTITVRAGASVTINFSNMDSGIPHNMAFYTDSSATSPIFKGNIITGQSSAVYTFTAPTTPGNYFFRCDVHNSMTGSFVVTQ